MWIECFNKPNKEIDIDLYYCGYEDCHNGFSVGPSQKDEYLVHCVTKGSGFFKVDGKVYRLEQNECFVIFPGQVIYYWSDDIPAWSFFWFAFNGQKVREHFHLSEDNPIFRLDQDIIEPLWHDVTGMIDILGDDAPKSKTKLLSHLYNALSFFENNEDMDFVKHENKVNNYVEKAILFIHCNYSKKITVKDIVDFVKIDRTYFSKIFKKYTGLPPQTFILEHRIKKSKKLLKTTNLPLSEICKCIGIEKEYYFWRLFKRSTGLSPSEYRSANKL